MGLSYSISVQEAIEAEWIRNINHCWLCFSCTYWLVRAWKTIFGLYPVAIYPVVVRKPSCRLNTWGYGVWMGLQCRRPLLMLRGICWFWFCRKRYRRTEIDTIDILDHIKLPLIISLKKFNCFQIIRHAYLNDDAGFESSLRSLTLEESVSSSKLTCWKLVGCAQQTARKPLHVPCTTPWFKRHPNMGSQNPPAWRQDTLERLYPNLWIHYIQILIVG